MRLKPDYAEVYNNLGIVYGRKGWFDMAIEEFKRALVFEPHYIDARYNLALTYKRMGRNNEARKEFAEILKTRPDYDRAHIAIQSFPE